MKTTTTLPIEQWDGEHGDHLNWGLHGENVEFTGGETRHNPQRAMGYSAHPDR
jgi:hypothetical protein